MKTVRALIKELGGTEAVAAALTSRNILKRVGARSVEKWGDKNHVPYFWRPILSAYAKEHGVNWADPILTWASASEAA